MRRSTCAVVMAAVLAAACATERGSADAGARVDEPAQGRSFGAIGGVAQLAQLSDMSGLFEGPAEEPAPYDEPRESPDFDASEDHFAVVELTQPIVELTSLSLFGAAGIELRSVLETIRQLSDSENVEGLLIRLGEPHLSFSAAEELRAALLAFKGEEEGERRVVCHAERTSAVTYYLLTACDHIGLAPLGEVSVPGVTATPIHIRGLLDKIGVRPQFTTIGDHKTAAEPLTRESPSEELVETMDAVLDGRYRTLVRGIAEGRGLSAGVVRQLIDGAVYQGSGAEEVGLVDAVATFSAYREAALQGSPWRREELNGHEGQPDMDELMRFLGLSPQQRPHGDRVAMVYMVGAVVEGEGRGVAGMREEIASRPMVSALRVLAEDPSVKSVVVRIDSPGGSALASEQIWLALSELAEAKPLVVSMGGVAASGGYYIASPAETIYALETTLTGSIGVAGGKLVIDDGLDKLGISAHPMARGERALLGSPLVAWDSDDLELVRALMKETYDRFIDRVAAGRELSRGEVLEVAGGRVWTGADAAQHGLVDRIGGLDAALDEARTLGGVDPSAPVEVYPPEPSLLDLFASVGGASAHPAAAAAPSAEIVARVRAELDRFGLDVAETAAVLELLSLAVTVYESPITATAFTAAALR